jgi:hypothetical protein
VPGTSILPLLASCRSHVSEVCMTLAELQVREGVLMCDVFQYMSIYIFDRVAPAREYSCLKFRAPIFMSEATHSNPRTTCFETPFHYAKCRIDAKEYRSRHHLEPLAEGLMQ